MSEEQGMRLGDLLLAISVQPTNVSDEEIGVISASCKERCVRDDRAWSGIAALYRDFSGWHGPDFAFAPSEFKAGLVTIGIPVEAGFAKGLALREDLCVPVGRAA